MNDQQRIETAADNCEVLRARLAKYEDADGNPKAQPRGVVPKLRQVVTDALMGMISAVTSSTPPANEPPPPFIQAAIDRAVDRIARLNSSPVSAGEQCSCGGNPHTTQCLYEHFLSYSGLADQPTLRYAYFHGADEHCEKPASAGDERAHDTKGSRKALGAMNAKLRAKVGRLERELSALSDSHGEQVRDVSAMARVLSDRQADSCNVDRDDQWKIYGQDFIDDVTAMIAAAPSADSQGGGA